MVLSPGKQAVHFDLPSTHGEIALDDLKGKPFLLAFFSMAFTPT